MPTQTTRTSRRASVLQTAYGSSRSIPGEFISLTQRAAPSISQAWSCAPLSPLTPLPQEQSPDGPRFRVIPDDDDLYGDERPDTLVPGGGGGDDGNGDDPDNSPDDSSDTTTSDTEQNFGGNNLEDDLNNVPLAFEPFAQLADAIRNLTREALQRKRNTDGPKTKVREPDPFDGSNPKKLCPFVVQCEINFQANPKSFQKDRAKVTFAQSYLKGVETTQKPVKGALGNRRSKSTDQRLAMIRSVQVELMRWKTKRTKLEFSGWDLRPYMLLHVYVPICIGSTDDCSRIFRILVT